MMPCTHCFKTLGVESRMDIYGYLTNTAKATVSEIVDIVKLRQPTVSYHLKEMREAGLLVSSKHGKEVYYSLSRLCPHYNKECILGAIEFPVNK